MTIVRKPAAIILCCFALILLGFNAESNQNKLTAGATFTEPVTGMVFVFVPGGCFQMGSVSGDPDEKPVHEVCLDSYWIGRYEVTQEQWMKVMESNPSRFQYEKSYPVEQVSWKMAGQFVDRLNQKTGKKFSLPTEAQWEYAAKSRGKKQMIYAGGDNPDKLAWYVSNSEFRTHEVGTRKPNQLGIYDMTGNVSEWCRDAYLSRAYEKHERKNPVIPPTDDYVVIRGGSWLDKPVNLRTAYRQRFSPDYLYAHVGLRLCLEDPEP
jgi:formylglycine-generating enzyme required for sulfatase activity